MILLLIVSIYSYIISRFDAELSNENQKIIGYLKHHDLDVKVKSLGDLSIVTYNMEKKKSLLAWDQVNELIQLIDNSHVPILTLQEITKEQLIKLENRILPHYGISEGQESIITDPTNGSETFNPIIYDTEILSYEKSGVFKNNDPIIKNTYASWTVFYHKEKNFRFTVVNMNLYSTKSLVDSLELASILYDIQATPEIADNLVFLAGTINAMSPKNRNAINKKLTKLSNYGKEGIEQKNTLNTYMDVLNNTERDFIFSLNTQNAKAQPIYSSVLRLFKNGARSPVHSIISLTV